MAPLGETTVSYERGTPVRPHYLPAAYSSILSNMRHAFVPPNPGGLGVRVWGFRFRGLNFWLRVWGLEFDVEG